MMKWNHLPAPGALYDQDPQLIDEWLVIFEEKANHEKREQDKKKRKKS